MAALSRLESSNETTYGWAPDTSHLMPCRRPSPRPSEAASPPSLHPLFTPSPHPLPQVRLALDLGGGTGAFAEAVFRWHGDRVVVMTGQLWSVENDAQYGKQFPQVGVLAARGHVGVIMDMYSFLPFGESSLDAVHTSWTFHRGYPRTTLCAPLITAPTLASNSGLRPCSYALCSLLAPCLLPRTPSLCWL